MLAVNVKIIEELKNFVHCVAADPSLLGQFRRLQGDFTRSRKLPFYSLVILITKLCKKTLSVELDQFFEDQGIEQSCSVSALSQQRDKLDARFFYCWNQFLCHCFYSFYRDKVKRWKGYRVIAADGSTVRLVNKPALRNYFGEQPNQFRSIVMGNAFYHYDVLNRFVLHAQLNPCRDSEVAMAYQQVDVIESDMLMIYDRNFHSYKMMALHLWQEREIKFVIRGHERCNVVKTFIASGQPSAIAKICPSKQAIRQMYSSGYKISRNTLLEVRLVRVQLKDSVEVLVTNLWEEQGYSDDEFKQLYFLRWGIETHIGLQKNILQLEVLSGLKPQSVLQDFHAMTFMANLHALLIKEPQRIVDKKYSNRKYPVRINNNKSLGKLRNNIVALFFNCNPVPILERLYRYFIREPLPVIKGRSFERCIKKIFLKRGKHTTYTNYKPAF